MIHHHHSIQSHISSFRHPSASIHLLLFRVEAVVDLAVDPEKFAHLTAWMSVGALAISQIIFELAFVYLSVCPYELTPTVFYIIGVLAVKLITVVTFPVAFALTYASVELAFINATVFPCVCTSTFKFTIDEVSLICVSVYQFFKSIAMFESIFHLTFVI